MSWAPTRQLPRAERIDKRPVGAGPHPESQPLHCLRHTTPTTGGTVDDPHNPMLRYFGLTSVMIHAGFPKGEHEQKKGRPHFRTWRTGWGGGNSVYQDPCTEIGDTSRQGEREGKKLILACPTGTEDQKISQVHPRGMELGTPKSKFHLGMLCRGGRLNPRKIWFSPVRQTTRDDGEKEEGWNSVGKNGLESVRLKPGGKELCSRKTGRSRRCCKHIAKAALRVADHQSWSS